MRIPQEKVLGPTPETFDSIDRSMLDRVTPWPGLLTYACLLLTNPKPHCQDPEDKLESVPDLFICSSFQYSHTE